MNVGTVLLFTENELSEQKGTSPCSREQKVRPHVHASHCSFERLSVDKHDENSHCSCVAGIYVILSYKTTKYIGFTVRLVVVACLNQNNDDHTYN